MKRIIEIEIRTSSPYKVIKYIKNKGINIYNVRYDKNSIRIWIDEKKFKLIGKLYNAEVIKHVGISKILDNKRNLVSHLSVLFLILILLFFYTRIIVNVDLTTSNTALRNKVLYLLEDKGIKKFTFYKSDDELFKIKNQILYENRDLLEWINIERHGMKYVVNILERVDKNVKDKNSFCNIVATKDATVTRIISSSGVEVVETNDSVKKDDILITGEVKKDEEVKNKVCAEGLVYGKTWYTIDIKITKTFENIIKLDKKRNNLLIRFNNKSHRIFNDRLEDYVSDNKKILDIFGFELYLQKDILVKREIAYYDEEMLDKKIDDLIEEKMKTIIKEDGKILLRKVLKKEEKNSTIDMSIFIVAEEKIGTTVILE